METGCGFSAAVWLYLPARVFGGKEQPPPPGFAPFPQVQGEARAATWPAFPSQLPRVPSQRRDLLLGGVTHGLAGPQWELEASLSGRRDLTSPPSQGQRDHCAGPGAAARLCPSVGLTGAHASVGRPGTRARGRQGQWRRGGPQTDVVCPVVPLLPTVTPLSGASPSPREQSPWPLLSPPREVLEAGTHKGLTSIVSLPPQPLVYPFLPFIMHFNRVRARRMAPTTGGGQRPVSCPPASPQSPDRGAARRR